MKRSTPFESFHVGNYGFYGSSIPHDLEGYASTDWRWWLVSARLDAYDNPDESDARDRAAEVAAKVAKAEERLRSWRGEQPSLRAFDGLYGWAVSDDDEGGVWWPSYEASEDIENAPDPAARAVEICRDEPMRGRWSV